MIKIDFKQRKREVLWTVVALFFIAIGVSVFKFSSATSGFEITDELGGNIFPSAILSVGKIWDSVYALFLYGVSTSVCWGM